VKQSFEQYLKIIKKTQKRAIQQAKKFSEIKLRGFGYQDLPPTMIAIDGSNRWIWNNPDINARIAIIRTAYVKYEYNQQISSKIQLLAQDSRDDAILIAPSNTEILSYDIESQELHTGIQKIIGRKNPMIETLSLLRSLFEFKLAEDLALEHANSLIVMDGALTYVQLKEFELTIENIRKACKQNNNLLIGVSKRNTTRRLRSEMVDESFMREMASNSVGMVYTELPPVREPRQKFPPLGRTFLVKLHSNPIKTFRVDIDIVDNIDPEPILSHLAYYSQVDSYLGYPFPLVDAHTVAVLLRRVPDMYNHELIEAGLELGFSEEEILDYMITHENLEHDPFHRYLDETTR
jgi:hypothetical protein